MFSHPWIKLIIYYIATVCSSVTRWSLASNNSHTYAMCKFLSLVYLFGQALQCSWPSDSCYFVTFYKHLPSKHLNQREWKKKVQCVMFMFDGICCVNFKFYFMVVQLKDCSNSPVKENTTSLHTNEKYKLYWPCDIVTLWLWTGA